MTEDGKTVNDSFLAIIPRKPPTLSTPGISYGAPQVRKRNPPG
jgi:hypothetical protein